MDLAGKAYGVPAYMLAGGKFRDEILCYCDTDSVLDGSEMGTRLKARMDAGFKFLKMDVGIGLLHDKPGTLIAPPGALATNTVMHPFTGMQITDAGIDVLCDYVAAVREVVGYEVPLAVDHFGHLGLESCIRLGRALDRFSLAWYEDMIPWQFTDQYARLSQSVTTPICTGKISTSKRVLNPCWRPGRVRHPSGFGDLGRDYRNEENRRYGAGPRRRHGDAHGGLAGVDVGERSLRGGDREFSGPGKSRGGHPALERHL